MIGITTTHTDLGKIQTLGYNSLPPFTRALAGKYKFT